MSWNHPGLGEQMELAEREGLCDFLLDRLCPAKSHYQIFLVETFLPVRMH